MGGGVGTGGHGEVWGRGAWGGVGIGGRWGWGGMGRCGYRGNMGTGGAWGGVGIGVGRCGYRGNVGAGGREERGDGQTEVMLGQDGNLFDITAETQLRPHPRGCLQASCPQHPSSSSSSKKNSV